jgi:CheY-like chemotaxis protein
MVEHGNYRYKVPAHCSTVEVTLSSVNEKGGAAAGDAMDADRKVLLVEDEALVAALAVDALEELGYRALEAANAKSALEIARGDASFAFAIVDVGLPDQRGDALALELRKLRAGLPIIIATGYDGSQLDANVRSHPQTAVLNKPYDIAQLQSAIQSIAKE